MYPATVSSPSMGKKIGSSNTIKKGPTPKMHIKLNRKGYFSCFHAKGYFSCSHAGAKGGCKRIARITQRAIASISRVCRCIAEAWSKSRQMSQAMSSDNVGKNARMKLHVIFQGTHDSITLLAPETAVAVPVRQQGGYLFCLECNSRLFFQLQNCNFLTR